MEDMSYTEDDSLVLPLLTDLENLLEHISEPVHEASFYFIRSFNCQIFCKGFYSALCKNVCIIGRLIRRTRTILE
jgi:hypothetical protein